MPFKCIWDEEVPDLYHIDMYDKWTWQEFRETIHTSYEMLGKLERPVDIIVGFSDDLPAGSAIMHFTYAGQQPPNIRHSVMLNSTKLTTKQFIETIISAVDRMKGWEGPKFVNTLEEARTTIWSLRADN